MQNEKKDSGIGYIVLIVIILVLGFKLYQSYDDARLDDVKVLDYVRDNIPFYEVCSCYDEEDIKEYVSNKYIPSDIWYNIDVLQDYSWFELMDYGKKDMYGQNMIDFLNESKEEIEQEQKLWEWGDKWIRRQRG